jgi:hypothetical protein
MPKVEPYDTTLRFFVASDSRPDERHLVDLGENFPLGKCMCEQFSFRVQPIIDKGQTVAVSMRCKHIEAAREYLLAKLILELKKSGA